MTNRSDSPPYFTRLFNKLDEDDSEISVAFGKHVHWGLFPQPDLQSVAAADYDRAAEAMCLKMLELAGIQDGTSILDIGCGFGGTMSCLNMRYSRVEILGLNIDRKQVATAAESIEPRSGNRIGFVVADAAQIPLVEGAVDYALCVESVFHFDRLRFMYEVSRLLRSGGSLTLSDFVPDESAAVLIKEMKLSNNSSVQSAYGEIDISWPLTKYKEAASQCGLSLSRSIDVSQFTLPTYAFLGKCIEDWEDKPGARKFRRATNLLEHATRRGFISYQLMRFEKVSS